jgi:hypothetical protein
MNFLRVGHPAPLGYELWEIGHEVFGNGDDGGSGSSEDAHGPHESDPTAVDAVRKGNALLSPSAYGRNVRAFAGAMRAVDPKVQIGVVLDTPPMDDAWGPGWNPSVLDAACDEADFASVHWRAGGLAPPGGKEADEASVLAAPGKDAPRIGEALRRLFKDHCGEAKRARFAVTELGAHGHLPDRAVETLFAADAYVALLEQGAFNVDWLELHDGSFLDDLNARGPAYAGIEMVHRLVRPGDALVAVTAEPNSIAVHAARRANGSFAILLVNGDPKRTAAVRLSAGGAPLPAVTQRYDCSGAEGPILASATPAAGAPVTVAPRAMTILIL